MPFICTLYLHLSATDRNQLLIEQSLGHELAHLNLAHFGHESMNRAGKLTKHVAHKHYNLASAASLCDVGGDS